MKHKELDRIRINADIAKYLARGGKIEAVDHTANATYHDGPKRNRRDQVEWARRHNKVMR